MDKVFVGSRVSKLDTEAPPERISRVTLVVDGANSYTAGDDTGRTIEKTLPWATQAMAESVLRSLQGVAYQPFSGSDALLDPAAEVGDGVTVGEVYSVLAKTDITFDGLYTADIAAPGGDEIEDEYPYKSRAQRQAERQIAQAYSRIAKTAEQIRLEVFNELNGLSASIDVKLDNITSQVSGLNGQVASIKQYVDSITLDVSNGSESSTITLKSGSATISSKTIRMDGLVTFSGLSSGTTTIDGACIKTGTIDANRLNLTGAITFGDLDYSTQDTINGAINTANSAANAANSAAFDAAAAISTANALANGTGGGTFINGTTVRSPSIIGGTVTGSSLWFGVGGNTGSLTATAGFDGENTTEVIELASMNGLVLYAYRGMRINAYKLWVDLDISLVNFRQNGQWVNLAYLLQHAGS